MRRHALAREIESDYEAFDWDPDCGPAHSPPTLLAVLKFQKLTPSLSWQGQIVPPEGESSMTGQWQYQVRFDVNDSAVTESIRRKAPDTVLAQLFAILARHRALAKCQFDAFAEYVAAAEEHGVESYPLYEWTKATIENPSKKEKYLKSFTVYVDGREVYDKEIADAVEADLQLLAGSGLIGRISKYDTNPANNPQPPERPPERR